MSDFFEDEDDKNVNSSNSQGEYSYSKGEINQGESFYEWSPIPEAKPDAKQRKREEKERRKREKMQAKQARRKSGVSAGGFISVIIVILIVIMIIVGVGYFSNYKFIDFDFDIKHYIAEDKPKLDDKISNDKPEKEEKKEKTKKENDKTLNSTVPSTITTVDVSGLVENVIPAIVQVTNNGISEYQSFFGTYEAETTSRGSGIIISQDDEYIYIASNNHVVADAKELEITFFDNESVEGEIKGTDSSCDLAVIAVEIKNIKEETLNNIKVATIGDSDAIKVGNGCVVIGNAMGYGLSVTSGVISAKDCQIGIPDANGNVADNSFIQTDAAINPGNSGGALVNAAGEVIGIVSAKLSNEAVEGMGYAIPISYASSIIDQMVNSEVVSEFDASYLGIAGKDVTAKIAEANDVPVGVYVGQVIQNSGAEKAGIKEGDIIIELNDRKVTSMNTIQNILQYLPAGTTIDVKVVTEASDYKEEATYSVTLTRKFTSKM